MGVNPNVRRKARARALEFLFSLELTQYEWEAALSDFWETFSAKPGVREYCDRLINGVMGQRVWLDEAIDTHLKGWAPQRVGRIERSLLRLATYEMAFEDSVPRAVAINEAVELAKEYGSDEAPGFINALLDRIPEEALEAPPA